MRPFPHTLLLPFFLLKFDSAPAQCPVTVDAGPDRFACAVGEQVTLNGSVTGDVLGLIWTPAAGLDDPTSETPNATVNGPFTYTLTGFAEDPNAPNLVTNGDFEQGNTGFASTFAYNPLPITPGSYFITTSPSVVLSSFPPCDDHTFGNGTGNMMLVNGTGNPADVWCQTITVNPNTYYNMNAWVTSAPLDAPVVQFAVNGDLVGSPFQTGGLGCGWEQFSAGWFSGPNTSAYVCVTDQSTSGNGFFGDFFALDDIFFAEACSESDMVMVDVVTVEAMATPTVILPCNALPNGITLDGTGSTTGSDITYLWTTTNGNIVSGETTLMPTVNMEGLYTLTVTFDNGAALCEASATVEVLPDPNVVVAFAAANEEINCFNEIITIDGSGTSEGPTITYEWFPTAGIVSGGNTLFPNVNMGGTYNLIVTNSISGCTAEVEVEVLENKTAPTAMANVPGPVGCQQPTQTLNGTGSSTGSQFSYQWTTTNGHIISGENTLNNCIVDAAGVYQLTVTDDGNGCTAIAFVTVSGQSGSVVAYAGVSDSLIDCQTVFALLTTDSSSAGPNITYLWTTTNGHFTAGEMSDTATVDSGGIYVLTVTDTLLGCSATDTVVVLENTIRPIADAGIPATIGCGGDPVILDGTGSSMGMDFTHLWTTGGGNILNGETTLQPTVGAPGWYFLTTTDTTNACTAVDSVEVTGDANAPTAGIGLVDSILNCYHPEITLFAEGQSAGISVLWETADGNFLPNNSMTSTSATPEIDAPGTYTLTLTNTGSNCSASTSITIEQDIAEPTVIVIPTTMLDCDTPVGTLNASLSSQGPDFTFEWTTNNGHFLSGTNTLMPQIDSGGIYNLLITNVLNGCDKGALVIVDEDFTPPLAEAGAAQTIDCDSPQVTLDGTGSGQGAGINYSWTTASGNIISGKTTLTPVVNAAGVYTLTVTNTGNGCSATDSVAVDVLADFPVINAGPDGLLTCVLHEIQLAATGSPDPNIEYLWTTPDGNIISGETTLTPTVDEPGIYILSATNVQSSCIASDTAIVQKAILVPFADAGVDISLPCGATSATLDGTNSDIGFEIFYHWTTTNGNIVSGEGTQTPEINAPGVYIIEVSDGNTGCTGRDTVVVSQDTNAPTADAGQPDTITCNSQIIFLNGNGSSTGADFTYLWETANGNILSGETTLAPQVNAPGTYLLTVTNTTNNCQTIASVQIGEVTDGPAVFTENNVLLTCADSVLTLSATSPSGNAHYAWTTADGNIVSGEMTTNPTISAAGTYELTVTDQTTGCQSVVQVVADKNTVPPVASIAPPFELNCLVEVISLSGFGSSAGPSFTYQWSTANGSFLTTPDSITANSNAPGDYILTVTDNENGCTSTASVTVVQDTLHPTVIIADADQLGCGQSQVTLDATGTSTGMGYLWETQNGNIVSGATTLMPTVDAIGVYTLHVINPNNGCVSMASISVAEDGNVPNLLISPAPELTCIVNEITLDANGSSSGLDFSIQWTTTDGNILSDETTLSPTVNEPGTYFLTIVNTQNNCTSIDSIIVVENTTPPQVSAGPDLTLPCNGGEVEIQGSLISPLNVNFVWIFTPAQGASGNPFVSGPNTSTPWVNLPGDYQMTAVDPSNGCISTDEMTVTSSGISGFSFEKTDPDCLVPFGSITFTEVQGGQPPYSYSIDGQVFSPEKFYENLAPGVYALTVQDADGCEISDQTEIVDFQPISISLEATASLPLGGSFTLTPQVSIPDSEIASIVWTPDVGINCTDCLNPTATPSETTIYHVEITDVNGCFATAQILISITDPSIDVFVPNVFSPNGDGINDELAVFANEKLVVNVRQFRIFDRWGEAVFAAFDFPPNDLKYGWNGLFKNELMGPAMFVWLVEVELVNGERKMLEGEVVLVR